MTLLKKIKIIELLQKNINNQLICVCGLKFGFGARKISEMRKKVQDGKLYLVKKSLLEKACEKIDLKENFSLNELNEHIVLLFSSDILNEIKNLKPYLNNILELKQVSINKRKLDVNYVKKIKNNILVKQNVITSINNVLCMVINLIDQLKEKQKK